MKFHQRVCGSASLALTKVSERKRMLFRGGVRLGKEDSQFRDFPGAEGKIQGEELSKKQCGRGGGQEDLEGAGREELRVCSRGQGSQPPISEGAVDCTQCPKLLGHGDVGDVHQMVLPVDKSGVLLTADEEKRRRRTSSMGRVSVGTIPSHFEVCSSRIH